MRGRDRLRAVFVDGVVVAGAQGLVIEEADLVLTQVALTLGRLDIQARGIHLVADVAQDRLDLRAAEDRIIDVVAVRARQPDIAPIPGRVIGVLEEDELQLGPAEGAIAQLGRGSQLLLEDGARRLRDLTRPVQPGQIALDHRGVRLARRAPQGVEVEVEEHIAIPPLPGGERVAGHGVHLDIDGEQVVAPLRAMGQDVVEEEARVQPLALQSPLHVGEGHNDGVDFAAVDLGSQRVHREPWCACAHRDPFSRRGPIRPRSSAAVASQCSPMAIRAASA